jgi:hypothetical protein
VLAEVALVRSLPSPVPVSSRAGLHGARLVRGGLVIPQGRSWCAAGHPSAAKQALQLTYRPAWVDVMDDGHAQLPSGLEVGGDVIHEHDALRGNGQLLGSEAVDGRIGLAQSYLA